MVHPDYHEIGRRFRRTALWSDETPLVFAPEGVDLYHLPFTSTRGDVLLGKPEYRCEEHGLRFAGEEVADSHPDAQIDQNLRFRYSLVREHTGAGQPVRHRRGLVLFHGLNERSFTKYIPWAYQVWAQTGIPVILFPLSFHINRVLPAWSDLQQMSYDARRAIAGNENYHRFNAVISARLGTHPERFFWGAVQSYGDVVDLARIIRSGKHPHFAPDARLDFLGFSAGGYVPLALLLENEEQLFDDSRVVVFASAAAMRDVNLSSHLIVDHAAEVALMKLYVKYLNRLATPRMLHWLAAHAEGRWFNHFCGLLPDRTCLDARLRVIGSRILGIANTSDQVMTPGAMMNSLQGVRRDTGVRVEELDLGIHENPFASPDYNMRDRSAITNFLDVALFGEGFRRFIDLIVGHLAR
jgi:hypothetical protein